MSAYNELSTVKEVILDITELREESPKLAERYIEVTKTHKKYYSEKEWAKIEAVIKG